MHVKQQVRWAAVILLILAALWLFHRRRMFSPDNRLARALHDIRQQDGWSRRLHQEIWNYLPQIVDEYAPGLSPIPLKDVHLTAVQELMDLAPQSLEAVRALIEALNDPSREVPEFATAALRKIGPFATAAINPLLALDTPALTEPWRSGLFEDLVEIAPGDHRVITNLLNHVEFDPPFYQPVLPQMEKSAAHYSREVRDKLFRLYDERDELRGGLAAVIGRIPATPAEQDLFTLACLRDLHFDVRRTGLQLFIEKPGDDPAVLAELRNALLDLAPFDNFPGDLRSIYYRVIKALEKAGGAAWETAPLLLEACRRADPQPRLEAAAALWRITGEDAELRSALTNSFASRERAVARTYVVYTLGALTPEWSGAVDLWPLGLHEGDKQIRHQSILTL